MGIPILNWRRRWDLQPLVRELAGVALTLPEIHQGLQAGQRCPVRTVRELVAVARRPVDEMLVPSDDESAHFLWQAHGYVMAFSERHLQGTGHAPGAAVAMLGNGATQWLSSMVHRTGAVAPRLAQEYWLGSEPTVQSPTFTGSAGEHRFREEVHRVDSVTRTLSNALGAFASGEVALADGEHLLNECHDSARQIMMGVQQLTKSFNRRAAEFSVGMRQYLVSYACPVQHAASVGQDTFSCSYPVDGRLWPGPNAANVPGVPLVDFQFGFVDASYKEMVEKRLQWYFPEDRQRVVNALHEPRSLIDALATSLGVASPELLGWTPERLAAALKSASAPLLSAVGALSRLCVVHRQWNGGHMGAINAHVSDAPNYIPADRLTTYPVSCAHGVSGDTLEHARHIFHLRKTGFLATVLEAAVRMVTPAANDARMHSSTQG